MKELRPEKHLSEKQARLVSAIQNRIMPEEELEQIILDTLDEIVFKVNSAWDGVFHLAIFSENITALRLLIKHAGKEALYGNARHETPLHTAMRLFQDDMAILLLEQEACNPKHLNADDETALQLYLKRDAQGWNVLLNQAFSKTIVQREEVASHPDYEALRKENERLRVELAEAKQRIARVHHIVTGLIQRKVEKTDVQVETPNFLGR